MKGFAPSLFDKLMNDGPRSSFSPVVSRLSIEELKDAVARDLEAMLNTRSVVPEELLQQYPECSTSIIAYGLNDFAGMSLASLDDRTAICHSLEEAISRHEPRLRNVKATLEIHAKLEGEEEHAQVFEAPVIPRRRNRRSPWP